MIFRTILPLLISLIVSLALVPLARWLSFTTNHVSIPRPDRWNRRPTPTLGGIGIYCAFVLTLLTIWLLEGDRLLLSRQWSLLAGISLMFIVGLIDDIYHINPPVKLFFQILAAILVIYFGSNTINFFRWPIANIFITLFWLVGITNAVNLLDNMDGMAGGIALITSIFLSIFFWKGGNFELLIISLSISGSIAGFLLFNFPPAKIFMGDSGSMMLGFALASLAVARRTQASNILAIIGVPALVFILPIFDTGLVAITRILRGQSPVTGGIDHTSHRLVAFGLSERQAVLVLYGIAIISGLASIGLETWDYDLSLVMVPILLIVLSLFVAYLARLKVVTGEVNEPGAITRWLANFTYKRRVFELIFDFILIGISYYLAFWTLYGLNMTSVSMDLFLKSWPILLVVTYSFFYFFGIYKGLWRYFGVNDFLRFSVGAVLAGSMSFVIIRLLLNDPRFNGEVFLLFILFLLFGLVGSRSSFLVLDRIYNKQMPDSVKDNVIIYGAVDAGEIALRWILRNPQIGFNVVGFLDDDPLKWGSSINSVNILGDINNIEKFLEEKDVHGVIVISENSLKTIEGTKLKAICQKRALWIKKMRLEFELTE